MEAFCVKCRKTRTVKDPTEVVMKNKRRAVKGVCSVCGTKVFKFLPSK